MIGAHKVVELGVEQIYWNAELVFWQAFQYTELGRKFWTEQCMKHLDKQVADAALRKTLTPDYPVGARRILFCDDYYPTLQMPHVELVTDAITRVVPEGVVTADGRTHACDVLVYATGFETTGWHWSMDVVGRGGVRLADAWREGPEAYLGITTAGFPNMFMTYGPNTNLGHNSITFMIERQTEYIVKAMEGLSARGLRAMDVRRDVQDAFNAELQDKLAKTSWADPAAGSWYKNAKGKITQNWSGSCEDYRAAVSDVAWEAYETVPAAASVAAE
jgi:cation diffusion facilitator CzcD-associated flavoprotein CzcO